MTAFVRSGRALSVLGVGLALAAPFLVLAGIFLLGSVDLVRVALDFETPVGRVILFLSLSSVFGLAIGGIGVAAMGWNLRSAATAQGALGRAEAQFDFFRRTQREQSRRMRLYGALFHTVQDAVVLADAHGRILLWNPAAERTFGYTPDEALQMNVEALVPARLKDRHRAGMEHYSRTGHGRFIDAQKPLDLPALRKDGTELRVSLTLSPIHTAEDGGPLAIAIIRDVTEEKRAEDRLKESEERFRLLVAAVKDYAIFMLDPEGRVVTWNEGAERLEGYRAEEIIGRRFSVFYPEGDRLAGKPEALLARAVREGRVDDEGWRVRKDGSRFWADVVITALHDNEGNLVGFGKVTRDLTGNPVRGPPEPAAEHVTRHD